MFLLIDGIKAQEFRYPYVDHCKGSRDYLKLVRRSCFFCWGNSPPCQRQFYVPMDLTAPVFLHYELRKFYENHRYLVRSVDFKQLRGKIATDEKMPFVPSNETCSTGHAIDESGKIYFPCGQLANTMFSDAFLMLTKSGLPVPLLKKGISHPVLKRQMFINPQEITPNNFHSKRFLYTNFVKPKDWSKEFYEEWWANGGVENEAFVNWMQPSAKSTLRKLYAIIEHVPGCPPRTLCKGNYTMSIDYRFDAASYGGDKAFIVGTTSLLGTRNLSVPMITLGAGFIYAVIGKKMLTFGEWYDKEYKSLARKDKLGKRRDTVAYSSSDNELPGSKRSHKNIVVVRAAPPLHGSSSSEQEEELTPPRTTQGRPRTASPASSESSMVSAQENLHDSPPPLTSAINSGSGSPSVTSASSDMQTNSSSSDAADPDESDAPE